MGTSNISHKEIINKNKNLNLIRKTLLYALEQAFNGDVDAYYDFVSCMTSLSMWSLFIL